MFKYPIALIFLITTMHVSAQDSIILERGDTLHVHIKEISEEQIEFKRPTQDAVFKLNNASVKQVRLVSGNDKRINQIYFNKLRPWSLSLYPHGSTALITPFNVFGKVGYYLNSTFELTANFGIYNFSAGTNIHLLPPETNDFSPFIGFQMGYFNNDFAARIPGGVSYRFDKGLELALLAHFVDEWEHPGEDLYNGDKEMHKLNLLIGISAGWTWY